MQSYLAAQNIPSLKAIASIAGNSDLEKVLPWRPVMEKVYKRSIPGYAENKKSELAKRSVVNWLDKLPQGVPILLLHGDKDKRVNVQQSIDLAAKLKTVGHPHKLIVYPNDKHGLIKYRKALIEELIVWFKKHL